MKEKNKLIAEFMGGVINESNEWEFPDHYSCCINCLQYNASWDWLMKVVEKIETLDLSEIGYQWEGPNGETEYNNNGIHVDIDGNWCQIYQEHTLDPDTLYNEHTHSQKFSTKIDAVYEAVVEFIEVFNKFIKENLENSKK